MNYFSRAIAGMAGAFNRKPDSSVARVYGLNSQKDMDRFLNEPMERSFGFEGAWYDRTNSNWVAWRSSLDAILRTSIWILVGRCRDLQRTNSIVNHALNLWKKNVVGPTGVRMRMNLRKKDGSPEKDINEMFRREWSRFCCEENLTPAGDTDMVEFQKSIIGTVPIDGTCLIRVYRSKEFTYGVAFRILEFDLLDVTKFKGTPDSDVEIKFGIESLRSTGRVLAYWLYLSNPNDLSLGSSFTAGKSFRVPADEIIPVFKKERPMQTIGIPWFVRAMTNLHILQSYTKATLIKAQMAASYFVFITNQLGVEAGDQGVNGDPNGMQQMPVENGIALELKRGQDVKNLAPAQVAGDLATLFTWCLRFIGGDLDLSYHAFAEDTTNGNFASLRMAALDERAGYIMNQVWLASILRRMFRVWLSVQLLRQKQIKIDDAREDDLLHAVEWIGRRWEWVTPGDESKAAISLVNAGLLTRTQYAKDRGHEIDDVVAELEYEQILLEDGEIIIQTTSGQQMHFGQTDATAPVKPGKGPAGKDPDDTSEETAT